MALALALALPAALVLGWPFALAKLAGAADCDPARMDAELSPAARALVDEVFADLDVARLVDLHVHVAGIGTDGSGCEVSPRMRSWLHPIERGRFEFYLSAAGIDDLEHADEQYFARLLALADAFPEGARFALLAFDRRYREDGTVDEARTEFHVPNDWVLELCARAPERFVPVCSVHPYRADALTELERCAARGARLVKWLPNAMGIDPASPRCDGYYAKLRALDLTLLSHTGIELAVEAAEDQELGNPLRLRRPLDAGVRVLAAHCASLGELEDTDAPGGGRVPAFELFLRLMGEARYEGLLFGELSATDLVNRGAGTLRALLERPALHGRLVNGSDHPLPAMNVMVHVGQFERAGLLDAGRAAALRELYRHDPLLFDLALKRSLRLPGAEGGPARRFPASVFELPAAILPPARPPAPRGSGAAHAGPEPGEQGR